MQKLKEGQEVWVQGLKDWVWEMGTVESVQSKDEVVVVTQSNRKMLTNLTFRPNPIVLGGYGDLTSMPYLSEPTILSNLHRRSLEARPYTFMGSVLVTVNPLNAPKSDVKPESVQVGNPSVVSKPHPYAMAETALQQLWFGLAQRRRHAKAGGKPSDLDVPIPQTIVVGGESGAGKTRSSNMVLQHLVERCGGSAVIKVLPASSTVLEAFGNAATLRNDDSSRFGKLIKLHFDGAGKAIVGGSIVTYLLERNRITTHREGEKPYHIFLRLLAALAKDKTLGMGGNREALLGLSPKSVYRYLAPGAHKAASLASVTAKPAVDPARDARLFGETRDAFRQLGFSDGDIDLVLMVLAGVLHLGNVDFVDDDRPEGFVAEVDGSATSARALDEAVRVLGFLDKDAFVRLFCERSIQSGGGGAAITVFNEARQAREAADAVARAMYARLFAYLLERINDAIALVGERDGAAQDASPDGFADSVIGVLDIFGFESFQRNGFEQLLINYCNEALQATFNNQIFHAEVELYKREQLVLDGGARLTLPKGNSACMDLLESASAKAPGVLEVIEQQGKMPQASDLKLNDKLHSLFGNKQPAFGKVHPKDIDRHFVVLHYAGPVKYTVGSFLSKNSDALPKEVDEFFAGSAHALLPRIWQCTGAESLGAKAPKKAGSVVKKFRQQIIELKAYLDGTRCSFIRCVKPNPFLECKVDAGAEWFNRRYVTTQLKALSIVQTAEVLKNGFPTRVAYDDLTETYASILPREALSAWRSIGGGSDTAFVAALFWAFDIPADAYKLGLTRVFFRSGKLAELDGVLNAAADWGGAGGSGSGGTGASGSGGQERVTARFQLYFLRRRWRVVFAKLFAFKHFHGLLRGSSDRVAAAQSLQRWWRAAGQRLRLRRTVQAVVRLQRVARVRAAQRELGRLRKARAAAEARRERELAEKLERDRQERERLQRQREEKLRELARLEAEQKRAAAQRAEEARKADALAKAEAMLVTVKKNNAKREARMRQQLEHLEQMSAFTFGDETVEEAPDEDEEAEGEGDGQSDAGADAQAQAETQAQEQEQEQEQPLAGGSGPAGARKKSIMSRPRGRSSHVKSQASASSAAAVERKKQRERDRVRRAREMADARIRQLQESEELLASDFARAQHDARSLEAQIADADRVVEASRGEMAVLEQARREQRERLAARRLRQMEHLDAAGDAFAAQTGFIAGRARKSATASAVRLNALRFMLNDRGRKQRRRQPVRKSYMPAEGTNRILSESDDDSDDGYGVAAGAAALGYGHGATDAGQQRILEADGFKLPVRKQALASLLGPRWKPHDFALDSRDMTVSYFHKSAASASAQGKAKARASARGVFHLNDMQSAEPSVVFVDPPQHAEKPNVLRIVGGFMSSDIASRDVARRRQVLVLSIRSRNDLEDWVGALWNFLYPADALRLEAQGFRSAADAAADAGKHGRGGGKRASTRASVRSGLESGLAGAGARSSSGGASSKARASRTTRRGTVATRAEQDADDEEAEELAAEAGTDLDSLLAESADELSEWSLRAKLLARKGKYSDQEMQRILMHTVIVKRDRNGNVVHDDGDEGEEDADAGTKSVMCSTCHTTSAVAFDVDVCPACGAELPDDDDE